MPTEHTTKLQNQMALPKKFAAPSDLSSIDPPPTNNTSCTDPASGIATNPSTTLSTKQHQPIIEPVQNSKLHPTSTNEPKQVPIRSPQESIPHQQHNNNSTIQASLNVPTTTNKDKLVHDEATRKDLESKSVSPETPKNT